MKALSLWQPYATLVALGTKQIETRSWATKYRGPLAIHATKRFPDEAKLLCAQAPFSDCLQRGGYASWVDLPLGAIVAIVELADCVSTAQVRGYISKQELAFGDYSIGRWAWILLVNRQWIDPIPAKGAQGLWTWEPEVIGQ